MKDYRIISGFAAGINDAEMIPLFVEHFNLDFFLVAMPYTLLDQGPLEDAFPKCEKKGMGIILGAPYASGILVEGFGFPGKIRIRGSQRECPQQGPLHRARLQKLRCSP